MRVGNFSVLVPEGREKDSGHVHLKHGMQYQIRLGNHHHTRCDADVSVDGKSVGLFRLNSSQYLNLERPSNDLGKFTFFKANSEEAKQVGVDSVAVDSRGLIQVTFKPEKQRQYNWNMQYTSTPFVLRSNEVKTCGEIGFASPDVAVGANCCHGMSAGVTGLTGQSDQCFTTVAGLDYDADGTVVISIRLVEGECGPRPLASVKANPVPSVAS